MLIVGLMLAGCGSMENHVRNHGVASTSRPALQDRARIVFDCRMADDATSMSSTIPAHVYEVRAAPDLCLTCVLAVTIGGKKSDIIAW